jgi:hypothetical protein
VAGSSLLQRVELVRARLLADHIVIVERLGLDRELPGAKQLTQRASTAAQRLIPQFEARLIDSIRQKDRKPGVLGRFALFAILLWFPFLQPLLEGGLSFFLETGTWQWARGLYLIVSVLSATRLLMGFAVVAIVYVAILAGMYARSLRAVRKALAGPDHGSPSTRLAESLDQVLVTEILVPLIEPFQQRLERLSALLHRLDRLQATEGGPLEKKGPVKSLSYQTTIE